MEKLHYIKNTLVDYIKKEVECGLEHADTKELGEAIDMIKDMEEAIYYRAVTEAMDEYPSTHHHYIHRKEEYENHMEEDYHLIGKSSKTRKEYMELKHTYDKTKQMQELDKYVQELTDDILEMIHDSTPDEKISLSQKISMLATKIR